MEMSKGPLLAALFLFLVLCDGSLATKENQKSTYIVHVAKSEMPASLKHHSIWYRSLLKSVSSSPEMLYTYENAIHGFSTRLTPEEARLLNSQSGILKVLPERMYKPLTTRSPHFLRLDEMKETLLESNGGSDVVVGVMDTGVWPESKSFDDTGLAPIPSWWKGECESGTKFSASNCNKKLIGARFFSKGYEASSSGPINETTEFRSPRDSDGHGTHTASTAAGSPVKGASLFGYGNGTARGMAARARVAIYKVCWGESCVVSDILAAMDKAISDKVNVISMSLGGGSASEYDSDPVVAGAFAATERGIMVSASAGNLGPGLSSLANVAPWMMVVGAGTLDRKFMANVSLGNGQNYSGESLYAGNDLPHAFVPIIYAGNASADMGAEICDPDTLDPKKVKGKIVVCERGGNSRTEKGAVVKKAGGVGMVLANTEEEGEDEVADPHLLPAVSVGFKTATVIKKYLSSHPKPTATIVFLGTKLGIQPSPVVAGFSSRGPNKITPEILKPDLIAPGVNILAAWSKNAPPTGISDSEDHRRVDFNIISGTSMSCPHGSGIAALIKSVRPNWSPAAIRSALMTTAYSTYHNGKKLLDGATKESSTPLDIGAGHVDPVAALNPGLIYDLTADDYLSFLCALNYTSGRIEAIARRKYICDPSKHYSVTNLNYPSFGVVFRKAEGATVVKHTRTLTNVGAAGTYKAWVTLDSTFVKASVEPSVLKFKKNEKKSFTVTFTTSGSPPPKEFIFGRLEWSNEKTIVGSPITVTWDSASLPPKPSYL